VLTRNDSIKSVVDYINTHFEQSIRLEEIAKQHGWSREHLSRKFRKETGIHMRDYILNLRMNVAEKMLTTDSLPIKDIASRVGIEDVFYFTKLFKKKFSSPPARYLNSFRNK
jgi:transcriptional regulator GlxA family with amidase domain